MNSETGARKQAAGRLGGTATREKYGLEHFAAAGKRGGQATAARHGKEHYMRIGKLGGTAKARAAEPETAAGA